MSVVDQVKERLDIVEVVKRHVNLQKAGRNLRGLCPFHTEKTPSFFVFPEDQRWHCFGCDRGGDLFTFVMEYEGWDFRTALTELARQAGVELRPRSPEEIKAEQTLTRLQTVMAEVAKYYHTLLKTAPQAEVARAYLRKRGFTAPTLEKFQLGYSLRSWDAMRSAMLGKGFTVKDLVQAGLLVERDSGGTYDRFRDRVMIPIHDRRGNVIAFGGRVLRPDDQPKYMNSPQTPLFDKSKILFGLHLASRAIRQADMAIIVEGYMDVMIPHQAGYANVVAPMGTALSETHLKQLQRLTQRFILALDPDAAGIHATLRGMEVARETLDRKWEAVFDPRGLIGYEGRLNADIRVLSLPDELDPDELILEDKACWQELIEEAQPVIRFYFKQQMKQHDPREPKGKARIVDAMLPLLQDIANNVEREAYVQEISRELGLDSRILLDRLRVRERATAIRRQAAVDRPKQSTLSANLEAYVLTILMYYPNLMEHVNIQLMDLELDPLVDEDFSATYRMIWSAWLDMLADPEQDLDDLLPPDLQALVRTWMSAPLPEASIEQWTRDLLRTILRQREQKLRALYKDVQSLIAEAQYDNGDIKGTQYADTLCELSERLRKVQYALAQRAVQ